MFVYTFFFLTKTNTVTPKILTFPSESLCVEVNVFGLYSTWLSEFLFGVPVTNIALLKFKKWEIYIYIYIHIYRVKRASVV